MIDVTRTPAGKWFLNPERRRFEVDEVPKKVLNNMSRFSQDQIYELAAEMVNFRLCVKRLEYNLKAKKTIDDMEEFQVIFQREHYPDYKNKEELIAVLVEKMENVLNILVASNEEYWSVESDMCVYDIVECQASIELAKSRNTQGLRMDRTVKNAVNLRRLKSLQEEKSYRELIQEACESDDFEKVKCYLDEMAMMQERMSD
jgi:hypothetical protein